MLCARHWAISIALLTTLLPVTFAQVSNPAKASDAVKALAEGEAGKADSKADADNEVLQTIPADTTRAILKQFKLDNPDAREHKIGLVSEAFTEDASNPALKLERMWVGSKGTLLEITGLQRQGQPNSAAIAPESLRLLNFKTSQAAKLINVDGVQQVLDKRGGKVLILKAGDTMYLLMEAVDDLQAMSLNYLGWDNRDAKYFDRIDPRFRERYDAAYKIASNPNATPEEMKDFLVEFGKYDPDKKAPVVFMALINKMRAQNTFEGYYQAYLLVKDPADAKAAFKLVRNDEHRTKMEAIAIVTLADKSRLLDMELSMTPSSTSSREGSCYWFCRYNFTANRPVSGTVTLRAKTTGTPIKLKMGTYKVTLSTQLIAPRWGIRDSAFKGSFNRRADETTNGTVTLTLSPPNYTASIPVSFGNVQVVFFERGSAGGYDLFYATGDATTVLRFKSMELIK